MHILRSLRTATSSDLLSTHDLDLALRSADGSGFCRPRTAPGRRAGDLVLNGASSAPSPAPG
jgi:hypothetical protein